MKDNIFFINECLKNNFFKIFTSFIITQILTMTIFLLVGFFGLFAIVFFSLFDTIIQFGFYNICYCLYKEKPCILGNLFLGFKDNRLLQLGFFKFFVSFFCMILSCIPLALYIANIDQIGQNIESIQTLLTTIDNSQIYIYALCSWLIYFILIIIVCFSFCLTYFILFDNSSYTIVQALKQSKQFLKNKKLLLIKYCIKSLKKLLIFITFSVFLTIVLNFGIKSQLKIFDLLRSVIGYFNVLLFTLFAIKFPIFLSDFYIQINPSKEDIHELPSPILPE